MVDASPLVAGGKARNQGVPRLIDGASENEDCLLTHINTFLFSFFSSTTKQT
jgi:hypothetical protein